ncbi:MAG: complex I NDUFA9 subunit family protein [Lysobacteraceae bacterium]|nr:complex I NDUFA9 subunit family protein [Xanthomonadales bacterium]HPF72895.1 complex I NDUFA9 subunit family protein [Xanthomonadaceae bacterium]HRX99136.1 complex I NDUFA9 subunit family protein [Xanthomonadaceae bacterium]
MRPQRIVVLGGTGFVGSQLLPRLRADGHEILALSRNLTGHHELLRTPGVTWRSLDVYDQNKLVDALRGADTVINLVGILNEKGRDGSGFQRAHVELAEVVIAGCKAAGVDRLLQMSALNAGRGQSHYLRTRGEAEAQIKASRLDWTIFQPSVIFGPGDGLYNRFAGLLRPLPCLPLACADTKFAPVYVGDVVEAFARALARPESVGQSYELYGPRVLSLRDIVRQTAKALGRRRLVIPLPDALARLQALCLDFVPGKPFSSDNYRSLQTDSVGGIDGLFRLGITPKDPADFVDAIVARSPRQRRLDHDRLPR